MASTADMMRALQMTGGDTSLLDRYNPDDEEERMSNEAALKGLEQYDPGMQNRALEATGSDYRVDGAPRGDLPDAAVQAAFSGEAAGPEYSVDAPVLDGDIGPGSSMRELSQEPGVAYGAQQDLLTRKGERDQYFADERAAAAGEMETEKRLGYERAHADMMANREQVQQFEEKAYARLDEMAQLVDSPPSQTMGKIMGIVGSVIQMAASRGGNQNAAGAIGAGMQMLQQSMSSDVQQWAQQIQGNKGMFSSYLEAAANERGDTEHRIRVEKGMADLAYGTYDAALRRIGEQATSAEAKDVVASLQVKTRQEYARELFGMKVRQAQAAGAARRSRAEDALYMMPIEKLAAMDRNKLAEEVYQKRAQNELKNEGDVARIAKDRAAAAKTSAEGAGLVVQGLKPIEGATQADKAKAQEIQAAWQDLDSSFGEMANTYTDPENRESYDTARGLAIGSLNALANAGILNPSELEAWAKRLPEHSDASLANIANPRQWGKSQEDNLYTIRHARDVFRAQTARKLRTYNFERVSTTPGAKKDSAGAQGEW